MLKIRLYSFAIVGLGLAGFVAYDSYDKSANYVAADGRIQKVNQSCYLEDRNHTTDVIPCEQAEALNQSHPKYKTWRLKRDLKVTVSFKSPVDGNYYSSDLRVFWSKGDKVPKTGETMKILASSTEPAKARMP